VRVYESWKHDTLRRSKVKFFMSSPNIIDPFDPNDLTVFHGDDGVLDGFSACTIYEETAFESN